MLLLHLANQKLALYIYKPLSRVRTQHAMRVIMMFIIRLSKKSFTLELNVVQLFRMHVKVTRTIDKNRFCIHGMNFIYHELRMTPFGLRFYFLFAQTKELENNRRSISTCCWMNCNIQDGRKKINVQEIITQIGLS